MLRHFQKSSPSFLTSAHALLSQGAVEILFRGKPAPVIAEETRRYEERFANPYVAAGYGFVDDVILPRDTRARICRELRVLQTKVRQEISPVACNHDRQLT